MNWHRFVNEYERKREREEQEAECSERFKQFSRDDLQSKREEVEATLESLNRDFPDWEYQTESRAYAEIRRLEKERECIILELAKRTESLASPIVDEGAKRKDIAEESTNALTPEQTEKKEWKVKRGKFCDEVIEEMKRIRFLAVDTGRSMAEIEMENPGFAVWKLRDSLGPEDKEIFNHPRQWGPTVGYAKRVLSKIHGKSTDTITSWIKAYRRDQKIRKQA